MVKISIKKNQIHRKHSKTPVENEYVESFTGWNVNRSDSTFKRISVERKYFFF